MNLVLDTGILGRLCHPTQPKNRSLTRWLAVLLRDHGDRINVFLPEIADYELRRKLIHLASTGQVQSRSIDHSDQLAIRLRYLPITTPIMRLSAELWAASRIAGLPTTTDRALDGDVILAAQARSIDAIVVTENVKHLRRFTFARRWEDIGSSPIEIVPFVPGHTPPARSILAQFDDGQRFWVRPADLDDRLPEAPRSILTPDQVVRISKFCESLSEVDSRTVEQALQNFEVDQHPEAEIQIWERIAAVYAAEVPLRPQSTYPERFLLYRVLLQLTMVGSLEDVLATIPEAKGLPNLQRVVNRWLKSSDEN